MTQQLIIDRDLVFGGASRHTANIGGRPSNENQVVYYDDFKSKAIDATNDYTFEVVNSGSATVTVPHMLTLTTGAADNDDAEFAMGVEWYGKYNAVMEVRFRMDDVDKSAINVGFNDAQAEDSVDEIAIMSTGAGTITSSATNCALFFYDTDDTSATLNAIAVNSDTDGTTHTTSSGATDGQMFTVRVELIDNGTTADAVFYANNSGIEIDPQRDIIGFEAAAVPRATALCPYIALINHKSGNGETMDIDYIKLWQDRY